MGGFGGFKHTFKRLFSGFVVNRLLELDPDNSAHAEVIRYQQGTTPGLMLDATTIDFPGSLAKHTETAPLLT